MSESSDCNKWAYGTEHAPEQESMHDMSNQSKKEEEEEFYRLPSCNKNWHVVILACPAS